MSEGRKFQVSMSLSAQSIGQFSSSSLRDTATSASLKLAFRQSPESAQHLARMFDVMPHELSDQPDLCAFLRVARYPATTLRVPPYEEAPLRQRQRIAPRSDQRKRPKLKVKHPKKQSSVSGPAISSDDQAQGRRPNESLNNEPPVGHDLFLSDPVDAGKGQV